MIEKFRNTHRIVVNALVRLTHKPRATCAELRELLRAESIEVGDKMLEFIADEEAPSRIRWLYTLPLNRASPSQLGECR